MAESREYLIHQEDMGSIQISDDVIGSIAANAAMEVEGFGGLMSNSAGGFIAGKAPMKKAGKGVHIDNGADGSKIVTLSVMLKYGCNISEAAKKIQNAVYSALEGMTGLQISAVNVHVGGISFN